MIIRLLSAALAAGFFAAAVVTGLELTLTSPLIVAAERYARSLWRVLALVSCRGSIDFRVLPELRRDEFLADPASVRTREARAWWRVVPR